MVAAGWIAEGYGDDNDAVHAMAHTGLLQYETLKVGLSPPGFAMVVGMGGGDAGVAQPCLHLAMSAWSSALWPRWPQRGRRSRTPALE
jgi:hypothetical protein